ncbi:SAVED domain-containing protein [Burkholderia cepacia]|uniref:SAVED domain-containing protein n=1 Tax=Burkholderia cepacia TaxID=292 RepID=UPI0011B6B307|nr:SAVED domain-containing protein [Burkholderia cepacia]MDN7894241.1 SAVED domain-containing protein [Burkholderia cepacia]
MATPVPVSKTTSSPAIARKMADDVLAVWLSDRVKVGDAIAIVCADSLWKLYLLSDAKRQLYIVDPESKSKRVLKKIAASGLLTVHDVPTSVLSPADTADPGWTSRVVSEGEIDAMVTTRLEALGRAGRGASISEKTALRVWADAGCRCMFEGCGDDLGHIPLYQKTARIGYLAHIVASDPRGPRGNVAESHPLSDDAENIMLMCDGHHRLIDVFAPDEYDAARLRAMRARHVKHVRLHLDSLTYPTVRAVTLLANLANIPVHFRETDFMEAILATRTAMLPNVSHQVRRTQRDDRGTPDFWINYLREHELDITRLVAEFGGGSAAGANELAVFPMHHTATLVLSGRIIGEARKVNVFQYDRHRMTWTWDSSASAAPAGTFFIEKLAGKQGAEDALVTIELSANVPEDGAYPIFCV